MVWDREKVNAAARAYRERNREAVRARDRARSKTPEYKARVAAWRQANSEALSARDRRKRLLSVAPQIAGQQSRARTKARFWMAMRPSFEELRADHEDWLDSLDLAQPEAADASP